MTIDSRVKARHRKIGRKISYFVIPIFFSLVIMGLITAVSFFVYNYGTNILKKATSWNGESNSAEIFAELPILNAPEGYEWQ